MAIFREALLRRIRHKDNQTDGHLQGSVVMKDMSQRQPNPWPSSGKRCYEGYITKTTKLMAIFREVLLRRICHKDNQTDVHLQGSVVTKDTSQRQPNQCIQTKYKVLNM
jgi:hypothetical protein